MDLSLLLALLAALAGLTMGANRTSVSIVPAANGRHLHENWQLTAINRTETAPLQFTYTHGYRQQYDQLVHRFVDQLQWSSPKDVRLFLQYSGAEVTFLSIHVNQTSGLGQAYVLNGGIGQQNISLVVEALSIHKLQYVASIYGLWQGVEN